MPFSSLTHPDDLARASDALDMAWRELQPKIDPSRQDAERTRLAYIVASLARHTPDRADLARESLLRFFESRS